MWLEPYPDAGLGYEQREGVELAFIAALQHLPATQRAVLILREVLGFSAAEVAETLETTVASVNSALQRARKAVEERLPERSQQATLRELGDERLRGIVERYMDAMRAATSTPSSAMLAEDAAWSMPPLASWFGGARRVRGIPRARAAVGRVALAPSAGLGQRAARGRGLLAGTRRRDAYLPFALDVMTLEGDRIREITAFITRTTELDDFSRWPEEPLDGAAGRSSASACPRGSMSGNAPTRRSGLKFLGRRCRYRSVQAARGAAFVVLGAAPGACPA